MSIAYTVQPKVFHEYFISIYYNMLIDSFGFLTKIYLCKHSRDINHYLCNGIIGVKVLGIVVMYVPLLPVPAIIKDLVDFTVCTTCVKGVCIHQVTKVHTICDIHKDILQYTIHSARYSVIIKADVHHHHHKSPQLALKQAQCSPYPQNIRLKSILVLSS